jgi:hypothetical protein
VQDRPGVNSTKRWHASGSVSPNHEVRAMSCQSFLRVSLAFALVSTLACDASSTEAAPDAGDCAGAAPCYDRPCCGHSFRVCATSCEAGTWRWPVDDNCHFACHEDTGVDAPDAEASDADDGEAGDVMVDDGGDAGG